MCVYIYIYIYIHIYLSVSLSLYIYIYIYIYIWVLSCSLRGRDDVLVSLENTTGEVTKKQPTCRRLHLIPGNFGGTPCIKTLSATTRQRRSTSYNISCYNMSYHDLIIWYTISTPESNNNNNNNATTTNNNNNNNNIAPRHGPRALPAHAAPPLYIYIYIHTYEYTYIHIYIYI